MTKILAINGSYRDDGFIDRAVDCLVGDLRARGADVEVVQLRDYPIEFCLNCRECTQQPGEAPGKCVLNDGMAELVARIEQADAFVLASPTNFGTVTAVYKRFMERLVVYADWPWHAKTPKFRKAALAKKAVVLASCAAPGLLGRLFFQTHKQLKYSARVIVARTVGSLFSGLAASTPQPSLSAGDRQKLARLAERLI